MPIERRPLKTKGTFVRPGRLLKAHQNNRGHEEKVEQEGSKADQKTVRKDQVFTRQALEAGDITEEDYWDEERWAIRATAQRRLRDRLRGAGLLKPGRQVTEENMAIERKLRDETRVRLEEALDAHDQAELKRIASDARRGQTAGSVSTLSELPVASEPFAVSLGVSSIKELLEDASRSDSPVAIKRDWAIISDWLGHHTGPLTSDQIATVGKAFRGYFAIGDSPSVALRDAFIEFAEIPSLAKDVIVPPKEVREVFGRLLATDEEIAKAAILAGSKSQSGGGRDETPLDRTELTRSPLELSGAKILFITGAWTLLVILYTWIFAPFENAYELRDLDSEDVHRLFAICVLPLAVWTGHKVYKRLD